MLKITHPDYRLPIIEALSSIDQLMNGTTAPMAILGVDHLSGERGQYVIKYANHNRMTPLSSACEFLGAWMACELEIPSIDPVVINVSSDFIDILLGKDGYRAASQSKGLNFGSQYIPGLMQIPLGVNYSSKILEQIKMIYVFDIFIQNTDRGHQRPNVALKNNELFIYDHELAFSFLLQLPFLRTKTPWILTEADSELYKKHYFYRLLKGKEIDFSEQVDKLMCFDNSFWDKVFNTLPKEFILKETQDIRNFIDLTLSNSTEFTNSLNKTIL